MGSFSIWHWLVLGLIVLLLFGGRGKLPSLARDLAQSINSFKKGMKESKDAEPAEAPKEIEGQVRSEAVKPAAKDQDAKA